MTTFRPAASSAPFDEMMELSFELLDREHLMDYLREFYDFCGPTEENVEVKPYHFDERNQWDTYLVTIDGSAVLFCDGPVATSHPSRRVTPDPYVEDEDLWP